jgi:hypothetical protein
MSVKKYYLIDTGTTMSIREEKPDKDSIPRSAKVLELVDYSDVAKTLEELKEYKELLFKATEALEFYASDRNWRRRHTDYGDVDCIIDDSDEIWSTDRAMGVGGLRAKNTVKLINSTIKELSKKGTSWQK